MDDPALDDALARIRNLVGARGWIEDTAEMEPHLVEWRNRWRGRARAVVRPGSTEEVAEVVRIAAEVGIPIVPQAGNTSLCGGSVPDEDGRAIVLSVSRLARVREIDALDYTMTVEAGCVLADVQRAAAAADRLFPLSLAAEGTCEIGGNLSTNAGGVHVLRYGNARQLVLGLEVVLPDGRVWDGLRRLRKDNTGYALRELFLGAEGTLGIITAAVLKLFPRPRARWVALAAVRDVSAALELLSRTRAATGDTVSSFELIPRIALDYVLRHIPGTTDPLRERHERYVLVELDSPVEGDGDLAARGESLFEKAVADGLVLDAAVAESDAQIDALWKLRESISEAQKGEGASVKHDVAVPVSRVPEFLDEATRKVEAEWPGVRVVAFGHLGDGNIHFNLSVPEGGADEPFLDHWSAFSRIVHDVVTSMNGSIAAEHGIGRLKRDDLAHYKSATEMDLMRALKRTLDPKGIMNPGRVV
ncbi:MAG: FAD-binding oxidoreductase [Candidatus Binatia bacterium]|nr:FAD-binding oxidoreductase [Candidatus Binatia bacterium]